MKRIKMIIIIIGTLTVTQSTLLHSCTITQRGQNEALSNVLLSSGEAGLQCY